MNSNNKDLEWSFKPIIYWISLITGIKLNRKANDGTKPNISNNLNRFFTLFSALLTALNLYHAVYYVFLLGSGGTRTIVDQINRIADDGSPQQSQENITSAAMVSRMIDIADHAIFLFGTGLSFFIVSFSKLRNLWSSLLEIEQQMGLTMHNYNHLRKIYIFGLFLIFLVN